MNRLWRKNKVLNVGTTRGQFFSGGIELAASYISLAFEVKVKAVLVLEAINMDMTVKPWEFKCT